jgi:predicted cupin superfamily sugar epimerase
MMSPEEKEIVTRLGLKPHSEGGFFKETYRSDIYITPRILPDRFGGRRSLATSIVFFLPHKAFSAFHRLKQDEVWNFHGGDSIEIHCILSGGEYNVHLLGIDNNAIPQIVIRQGAYFAAFAPRKYSLVGCIASPGFDFSDLELPTSAHLIGLFPTHKEIIKQFTRS